MNTAPILPTKMYNYGFINPFYKEINGQFLLKIEDGKEGKRLVVCERSSLSFFFDKILRFFGLHSTSFEQIGEFFAEQTTLRRSKQFLSKLTEKHSIEEITNLIKNLDCYNFQVEKHNNTIRWYSLRRRAKTIDALFINALKKYSDVENKGLIQTKIEELSNEPGILHRQLAHRFFPENPQPEVPPKKLINHGNTCHFASAINFLASLFPVAEVLSKAIFIDQQTQQLRNALLPILVGQGIGKQTPDKDYQKLMRVSRIGAFEEQNIHDQQDAAENLRHFLQLCDVVDFKNSRENLSAPRLAVSWIETKTYGHESETRKMHYKYQECSREEAIGATEIDLMANEIEARKQFSYQISNPGDYMISCPIVAEGNKHKKYKTTEETLSTYLQPSKLTDTRITIKTKDNRYFKITGSAIVTRQMANAPDALMLEYMRYYYNDLGERKKLDDPIATPKRLVLGKEYFADNKERSYILCATILHKGVSEGGHYAAIQKHGKMFANDDIYGVTKFSNENVADKEINKSYIVGYVLEETYAKYQSAQCEQSSRESSYRPDPYTQV